MKRTGRGRSLSMGRREASISVILAVSLTLVVVVAAIVAFSMVYVVTSHRGAAHLEEKADEFYAALEGILQIPLWNLDSQNIKKIGEAFTHNELFERLQIFDAAGAVCYDFDRGRPGPVVERSGTVRHEGESIGRFALALTTGLQEAQQRQLFLSGLGMLIIIVLSLAAATGVLTRLLLRRLFQKMDRIADTYASESDIPHPVVPYVEFRPLIRILGELRDRLNDRMRAVQDAEKKYRTIFENAAEGIFQTTLEGRYISANPAVARMLGYDSPEDLIASVSDIGEQIYVDPVRREEYIRQILAGNEMSGFQAQFYTRSRDRVWLSLNSRPVCNEKGELQFIEGMALDITQQKQAEEEHDRLEQQLAQAHKMESVGRLAGGVAHDFNNMLGIILGYSDLILEELPSGDPNYEKIQEIRKAAQRSADLTRQLLAFARKQTVSPKILDLNDTVAGMLTMLRRLLGENIDLIWMPGEPLPRVKMDPSQIDQILANLCINARDAIAGNGKITIETEAMALDDLYCRESLDMMPGEYVVLTVSDTGSGIDPSIREHIFEPFFTTREQGKGTGLGLATVYGIVKQNNGSITVYSEPGQGTAFRIYLPACQGEETDSLPEGAEAVTHGKGETVLLVEDEVFLLSLGERMLSQLGYTVFAANSPGEALRLAETCDSIDLLLTDVVMPEINGRALAELLTKRFPGLKCLFMSGYTADVIAHQGVLEAGVHFIQKPFSKSDLAVKIRRVLNG